MPPFLIGDLTSVLGYIGPSASPFCVTVGTINPDRSSLSDTGQSVVMLSSNPERLGSITTIFQVFGMTRPGFEPRASRSLTDIFTGALPIELQWPVQVNLIRMIDILIQKHSSLKWCTCSYTKITRMQRNSRHYQAFVILSSVQTKTR